MLGVASHEIIAVPDCLKSVSPLVSNTSLERYSDFESMNSIIGDRRELTFVPMRNALFLTIAGNRAETIGANHIVTGVCEADNANYSDCREVFVRAAEEYINAALGYENDGERFIHIDTPLLFLTKSESIRLAQHLPGAMEALAYSHTCYDGVYPPCGTCHACVLRAHGFEEAGVADPLVERASHVR
jgi:7-cyano-7-deazaguanine synthase